MPSLEEIVREKVAAAFDGTELDHFDDIFKMVVIPTEKAVVGYVLRRCKGNQVHTAKALGINRNTLRKKIKLYGIGKPDALHQGGLDATAPRIHDLRAGEPARPGNHEHRQLGHL